MRVLWRITNTGRVGFGYDIGFPNSAFNVGTGAYNLSVDELATARYNPNVRASLPGVPGAGACLGFNAARQDDADVGCALNTYTVNNVAKTGNGGALI